MFTFDGYSLLLADDEVRKADWPNIWRLGVVVFTRPEETVASSVLGPSLQYLHSLTGESVHFYFVGFCDQRAPGYNVMTAHDFSLDGTNWFFSPTSFASVQTKFEKLTEEKWSYSGGTDLLVVPYRIRKHVFYLDPQKALDIKLSKIVRQSDTYSPDELIQILVRQLKKGKGIDGLSNSRIMEGVKTGLKESLLGYSPKGIQGAFRVLEPFAVKTIG